MILDRLFICEVYAKELLSMDYVTKTYEIKAPSEAIAKRICINKFYSGHSDVQYLSIDAKIENKQLDTADNMFVLEIFNTSFKEICDLVENMCSLLEFYNLYENFNGYNYSIDGVISSFEMDFQGFCLRVLYNGANISIDRSALTYTANSGKKYVIEDNWQSIYLGN